MKTHSFPNGTVSVKMHKRKRLTLVVDRAELNEGLIARIEALEHENRTLRRRLYEVEHPVPSTNEGSEG